MRGFRIPAGAMLCVLLSATGASAAGQFNDLLRLLPGNVNAVILIDCQAAEQSPLGQKENWAKRREANFIAQKTAIPPSVTKVVLAAQLNPSTLNNAVEFRLAKNNEPIPMAQLARNEGTPIETVGGKKALLSRRNAYFVQLEPDVLGVMGPPNRQELGRWVRFANEHTSGPVSLSAYLKDAVGKAINEQVIVAIDLGDVLDPDGVRRRLANAKCLAGKKVDQEALARIITGLKGLRLYVRVVDAINGELQVDFSESVEPLAPVAKPLILEALAGAGAYLEDFNDWYARAEGNTVTLQGKFSEAGLRHILSIIPTPAAAPPQAAAGTDGAAAGSPSMQAAASQHYYKGVTKVLDDLGKQKPKSFSSLSYWLDKSAKAIGVLPILNVDDELIKYGTGVANVLRVLSQSARGTAISSKLITDVMNNMQVTVPDYYNSGYASGYGPYGGGWNYYYAQPRTLNPADFSAMQASGSLSEVQARMQGFKAIEDATAAIRVKMTQKYQVEF
jgi:hypothetical protein